MTAFAGFGEGAVEFYDGLEADNSKAYWTDQRATYERDVKEPMLALLAACEAEFGAGKVFRPYRDVRFSADKTPYKSRSYGVLPGTVPGSAGRYAELSSHGLYAGTGYHRLARDQLARYRAAVDDAESGTALAGVVAEALVALVLAEAALEKFGGDSVEETRRNCEIDVQGLAIR